MSGVLAPSRPCRGRTGIETAPPSRVVCKSGRVADGLPGIRRVRRIAVSIETRHETLM
jgi:hypothetical protein